MSEKGPVEIALETLHLNNEIVINNLSSLEERVEKSRHDFLMVGMVRRWFLDKQITKTSKRIDMYRQAEEGISFYQPPNRLKHRFPL